MADPSPGFLKALLGNLRGLRQKAGLTEAALEERLILGPGWVSGFERGQTVPSIDVVLAILHEVGAGLPDLLVGLPEAEASSIKRCIFAEPAEDGIRIRFDYAKHDAQYSLPNSTLDEFGAVIRTLRDGLAGSATVGQRQGAVKSDAVARAFLEAIRIWPHANPSDLWAFVVSRAFCDPYNHPAKFARLNLEQSWKRTSGWALELVLVHHYGPFLKKHGVNLDIAHGPVKQAIVGSLNLPGHRVEADKIDVVLCGDTPQGPRFFGVVHVKASFAERRTDDVPLSTALIRSGYTSPFWTLDNKSGPSAHPVNRGELGFADGERSAKRKDIEDEGYFTGCFSYNQNTRPSPISLPPERRVYVCNFGSPDDAFSRFIISRWQTFPQS